MSSSAVADLSASRWTKADGGESAARKKFESKRLFQSEALQKPRRGDAAEEVKADCFSEVERNALSCFLYLRTGPPDCGGLIFCEWV